MNLQEKTLSYQKAISILTSQGKFHINLGLDRISKLMELLDNPQDNLKVIHVAGTNGKGSTCAMLASVLAEAGYKTGLYTSPHLVEYTERIKIDGQDISQEKFAGLILEVIELANKNNIPVTEFEILTAIAFKHFYDQKVDYVVLETGLGGRLDATNIIKHPLVSIITTLDMDHVDRLGDTIDKIAFEKAGIIKEQIPIITLKDNKGLNILKEVALKRSSSLILSDSSKYKIEKNSIIIDDNTYKLPLLGLYQIKNLSLVLETIKFLNKIGLSIEQDFVKSGLEKVKWPARFQYIKEQNLILDGAHNPSGAKLLRESLDFYFPDKRRIWIYSSLNTKDYELIIKILFKKDDMVICTNSSSKNAIKPHILEKTILTINPSQKVYIADNVKKAINLSFSFVVKNHLIIVAGSLYTIGEFLEILNSKN